MPITSSARVPMLACARAVRAFLLFGFDTIFSVRVSPFLGIELHTCGHISILLSVTESPCFVFWFAVLPIECDTFSKSQFRLLAKSATARRALQTHSCARPVRPDIGSRAVSAVRVWIFENALHVNINVASLRCHCSRDSDTGSFVLC